MSSLCHRSETIPKQAERKEMSRFIEDYNTVTLPLDKYYDLEVRVQRLVHRVAS